MGIFSIKSRSRHGRDTWPRFPYMSNKFCIWVERMRCSMLRIEPHGTWKGPLIRQCSIPVPSVDFKIFFIMRTNCYKQVVSTKPVRWSWFRVYCRGSLFLERRWFGTVIPQMNLMDEYICYLTMTAQRLTADKCIEERAKIRKNRKNAPPTQNVTVYSTRNISNQKEF